MAQIFFSLGSNMNRHENLRLAVKELGKVFGTLDLSPVYQNEAVGFEGDDFYNLVVGTTTDLNPTEIQVHIKRIEDLTGRDRSAPKFSARTLDIDLLNYDRQQLTEPVTLPREEILYHAFVLKPFADLAPDWIHPATGESLQQMWSNFDQGKQPLVELNVDL